MPELLFVEYGQEYARPRPEALQARGQECPRYMFPRTGYTERDE